MGDWVEVANDVFMNFIVSQRTRFRTTDNLDFDGDVQDTTFSRNPVSSALRFGACDCFFSEIRFGVDFRYKKNLTVRTLLEAETVLDGNLIDDRSNSFAPGGGTQGEDNGPHIERFWIDYRFPGTPVRMRLGAHLWFHDAAGLVGDDDPGIFFFANLGPKKEWELKVAAVLQQEASRLGLTNDNDNVYYLGTVAYNRKPYRFALDLVYQRDRFTRFTPAGIVKTQEQQHDNFLIMPNVTWSRGSLSGLLQFNLQVGQAEGVDGRNFDIFSWAVVAQVELDLGIIRPLAGIIYARGDDDPNDDNLEGFNNFAHNDIGLTGFTRFFNVFDGFMNDISPNPARSPLAPIGPSTLYNFLNDRIGNTAHAGIKSAFSNPGTILIPIGVKIFPLKGHQINLWYMYTAMQDTAVLEALAGRSIDETLWHELGFKWIWTLNKHFDIRARGVIAIPDDGIKDLAATVTCPDGNPCKGNDPALVGQLEFNARF
jgi:hypothetical protein